MIDMATAMGNHRVKIVLAGGSGWLGSALTRALLADGHDAVVLSRSARHATPPGAGRSVVWDGRTLGSWAEAIDGSDAVVNFAGASVAGGRWTERRKARILMSRIEPTMALVHAIERAERRPAVLVSTSAVGYYGSQRGSEPVSETEPPGHDFLAQVTSQWEAAAKPAAALGVRVVVPRVGVVLGRKGALPPLALP